LRIYWRLLDSESAIGDCGFIGDCSTVNPRLRIADLLAIVDWAIAGFIVEGSQSSIANHQSIRNQPIANPQ
jgi:hypothetical protein